MRSKLFIGSAAVIIAVGAFIAGMLVERHFFDAGRGTVTSELDGVWKGVSWETEEGKKDDLLAVTQRLTIAGDKLTLDGGYKFGPIPGNIAIDPTQSPKTFDAGGFRGDAKSSMSFHWVGIYERQGDTLKLCFIHRGKGERPTEFKANPAILFVLRREKD